MEYNEFDVYVNSYRNIQTKIQGIDVEDKTSEITELQKDIRDKEIEIRKLEAYKQGEFKDVRNFEKALKPFAEKIRQDEEKIEELTEFNKGLEARKNEVEELEKYKQNVRKSIKEKRDSEIKILEEKKKELEKKAKEAEKSAFSELRENIKKARAERDELLRQDRNNPNAVKHSKDIEGLRNKIKKLEAELVYKQEEFQNPFLQELNNINGQISVIKKAYQEALLDFERINRGEQDKLYIRTWQEAERENKRIDKEKLKREYEANSAKDSNNTQEGEENRTPKQEESSENKNTEQKKPEVNEEKPVIRNLESEIKTKISNLIYEINNEEDLTKEKYDLYMSKAEDLRYELSGITQISDNMRKPLSKSIDDIEKRLNSTIKQREDQENNGQNVGNNEGKVDNQPKYSPKYVEFSSKLNSIRQELSKQSLLPDKYAQLASEYNRLNSKIQILDMLGKQQAEVSKEEIEDLIKQSKDIKEIFNSRSKDFKPKTQTQQKPDKIHSEAYIDTVRKIEDIKKEIEQKIKDKDEITNQEYTQYTYRYDDIEFDIYTQTEYLPGEINELQKRCDEIEKLLYIELANKVSAEKAEDKQYSETYIKLKKGLEELEKNIEQKDKDKNGITASKFDQFAGELEKYIRQISNLSPNEYEKLKVVYDRVFNQLRNVKIKDNLTTDSAHDKKTENIHSEAYLNASKNIENFKNKMKKQVNTKITRQKLLILVNEYDNMLQEITNKRYQLLEGEADLLYSEMTKISKALEKIDKAIAESQSKDPIDIPGDNSQQGNNNQEKPTKKEPIRSKIPFLSSITIGRNVKISWGLDEEHKLSKSELRECVNMPTWLVVSAVKDVVAKFEYKDEKLLNDLINDKKIDPTVLAVICKSDLDNTQKTKMLNTYINDSSRLLEEESDKCKNLCKVSYDYDELSKSNFIKRVLGMEVNEAEKEKIIERAEKSKENNLGTIEGEYKPKNRLSRFLSLFNRNKALDAPYEVLTSIDDEDEQEEKTEDKKEPKPWEVSDEVKSETDRVSRDFNSRQSKKPAIKTTIKEKSNGAR